MLASFKALMSMSLRTGVLGAECVGEGPARSEAPPTLLQAMWVWGSGIRGMSARPPFTQVWAGALPPGAARPGAWSWLLWTDGLRVCRGLAPLLTGVYGTRADPGSSTSTLLASPGGRWRMWGVALLRCFPLGKDSGLSGTRGRVLAQYVTPGYLAA